MTREEAYREACSTVEARKMRFLSSAKETKARVTPARLKQDAKDKAVASLMSGGSAAVGKIRQRPIATSAAMGAFVLYVARRPLGRLVQRLYLRWKDRSENTGDN